MWRGNGEVLPTGVVLVDRHGTVGALGPLSAVPGRTARRLAGVPVLQGAWVGPALVDRHVHLAFGDYGSLLAGGVAGVRDLGAPLHQALAWRRAARASGGGGPAVRIAGSVRSAPRGWGSAAVRIAGPVLTAPGGYPSNGWGAAGFALPVPDVESAVRAVRDLAAAGVDVIKLALEPADDQPVPSAEVAAAVVRAAHDAGIPVTVHALSAAMVARAVDAGADELAHTPTEPLPAPLVARVVAAGMRVVSTIGTLREYPHSAVEGNAAALVAAGVRLLYGTDLGNAGTRPGADPRELELLAIAGLGRDAALRAAVRPLTLGTPAALVVLQADPLLDPDAWLAPLAVVAGATVISRQPSPL